MLQSHFSRAVLGAEQREDLSEILLQAPRLLQALVDVASSHGWLKPALIAMELSQMCVQGLWIRDSPLKQVPTFETTPELLSASQALGVESVYDLIDLDAKKRADLLQKCDAATMSRIASFCNAYPSLEATITINGQAINSGVKVERGQVEMQVVLERDQDQADVVGRFPGTKSEIWWLVLGDSEANVLYAIKRCSVGASTTVKLSFAADEAKTLALKLYVMCDSYLGCDQEFECEVYVA